MEGGTKGRQKGVKTSGRRKFQLKKLGTRSKEEQMNSSINIAGGDGPTRPIWIRRVGQIVVADMKGKEEFKLPQGLVVNMAHHKHL